MMDIVNAHYSLIFGTESIDVCPMRQPPACFTHRAVCRRRRYSASCLGLGSYRGTPLPFQGLMIMSAPYSWP